MTHHCDVAILGAGPAGASAAIEARARGISVVVFDEAPTAGGQVYRITAAIRPTQHDHDRAAGNALRALLAASGAAVRLGQRVWDVEQDSDGFTIHALGEDGPACVRARALIVANGAQERHVPVAGWERPGVMGLAAATVLLKAQRVLPGHNVVVAGTGPLLLVVAAAILKGGGRVAAVIDANPRSAWIADWRTLVTRPDLLLRGAAWLRTLVAHGVMPIAARAIRSIDGNPTVTGVTIGHVDGRSGNERTIACDAVCLGYGLTPATDVTRLLRVDHVFGAAAGGWHAQVDADQCSSLARLYVCGDAAGVAGAAAALPQGRLAALAAARDLGHMDAATFASTTASLRREAVRAAGFGAAMNAMSTPPSAIVQSMTPETVVCLCEHLTRKQLDAAVTAGAATFNDLKSATRCGMGPCGGRLCEDTAARLIALNTGATRAMIGQATGRPPLRPVELDALVGKFDYDALPMAQPAPL